MTIELCLTICNSWVESYLGIKNEILIFLFAVPCPLVLMTVTAGKITTERPRWQTL
jgi:hypothetical protein